MSSRGCNPRRGGRGGRGRVDQRQKFGRGETMATAQQQVQEQRRREKQRFESEYSGGPPPGVNMIQARLIIPGEHLVPKGFSDILDEIFCQEHKVWITRAEDIETCLDISSTTVKGLQDAIQAINWKIHDMRLSEESVTTQFLVQAPSDINIQLPIVFEVDKRPTTMKAGRNPSPHSMHSIDALSSQLAKMLPSSFKALVAIPGLKMRATFGHLVIKAKRKTTENLISFREFSNVLGQYSSRGGGVVMQTELSCIDDAEKFLALLLERSDLVPEGIKPSMHHRLEFVFGKKTVSAHIPGGERIVKATSPTWAQVDRSPPLDWSVLAPDMAVDWNIRVDSMGVQRQMPEATARLANIFTFDFGTDSAPSDETLNHTQYFKLPTLHASAKDSSAQSISNVCVQSSARLQFRDTVYEIEITITQHWEQAPKVSKPDRTSWSLSVYGINWDEVLNHRTGGEASGSFEDQLSEVWSGQGSLKERLQEFLECILLLQTILTEILLC